MISYQETKILDLDQIMFLEPRKLLDLAQKYRKSYEEAKPFPHIVIDNFFPKEILEKILEEFPDPKKISWKKYNDDREKKLGSTNENQLGKITRLFLYQLNSSNFVYFLELLTGINGLIPDPHLDGGGMHQIEKGGFFKVHVDINYYRKLKLDRRVAVLLYLNKDWEEEYGGYLELWNQDMTECVDRILPIFNRCIIFSSTDFTYHGHPDPLNCPEDQTRKSLALYYYTNGRPNHELSVKRSTEHTTIFAERPGETIPKAPYALKNLTKRLLPPILFDIKYYWEKKKAENELKKY